MNMMIKIINLTIMLITIYSMIKIMNKFKNTKNFMNNLESSFNNINNFKMNMSMNFTFIMIIFILFDVEMIILVPMIINQKISIKNLNMMIMFITFMFLTTIIEMKNNKIKWIM